VGISVAAKRNILFKEAGFLETMAKSSLLALDKTGTITQGRPSVIAEKVAAPYDANLLYALTESSTHPIAQGVRRYLEAHHKNLKPVPLTSVRSIQAKGIEAATETHTLAGGNAHFMASLGIACEADTEHSLFYFAVDGKLVAAFELRDTVREGAKEAIAKIKALGIKVVMLTGDHEKSARNIAREVGIEEVHAQLLPQQKSAFIQQAQQAGHIVVMAGDGINDAVALAQSNIAIAMGNGADVAISVSDVVLLDESPRSIYDAYRISRRTYRAVKENLGFSLLYNLVAVPLAVAGLVNPLVAALSMSLSSLIVVGNSMRIRFLKFRG
jgi:Cu+-exporting ATPase